MGNATSLKALASPDPGSSECLEIELNGILQNCQAFLSSIEHQTTAALGVLEGNGGAIQFLHNFIYSPATHNGSDAAFVVDQLQRAQVTLSEQLKGLKDAGQSFKHVIDPLRHGIYPINIKLHSDEVEREKDVAIEQLNKELQSLKDELQSKEKELSDKEQLQRRNSALLAHTEELKQQIEFIKQTSDRHEREKNKTAQEKDNVQKTNRKLNDDIVNLKGKLSQLSRQNSMLEQENMRRREEIRRQIELEKTRKITVHVQLFSPRKGDLTSAVLQEMTSMLETQFTVENKQLVTSLCETSRDVNPDKAVLILCINASRLGSDVESALRGLSLNKCQGLIILHHKDTHALPNQPSERLLTSSSSELKKLGGIFDMAFLSGKGIYPCDMNNRAVSELVNFIKTLSLHE